MDPQSAINAPYVAAAATHTMKKEEITSINGSRHAPLKN
jgi:hypothetical protein